MKASFSAIILFSLSLVGLSVMLIALTSLVRRGTDIRLHPAPPVAVTSVPATEE